MFTQTCLPSSVSQSSLYAAFPTAAYICFYLLFSTLSICLSVYVMPKAELTMCTRINVVICRFQSICSHLSLFGRKLRHTSKNLCLRKKVTLMCISINFVLHVLFLYYWLGVGPFPYVYYIPTVCRCLSFRKFIR